MVLQKNVAELGPTKSRYSSLNYLRWRIELASVLFITVVYISIVRIFGKKKKEEKNKTECVYLY